VTYDLIKVYRAAPRTAKHKRDCAMAAYESHGERCDSCGALFTAERPAVMSVTGWRTGDLCGGCVSRYQWSPADWTFGRAGEWPSEHATARPFYIAVRMNGDGSAAANPAVPYPESLHGRDEELAHEIAERFPYSITSSHGVHVPG
jgi:hypothetical protein